MKATQQKTHQTLTSRTRCCPNTSNRRCPGPRTCGTVRKRHERQFCPLQDPQMRGPHPCRRPRVLLRQCLQDQAVRSFVRSFDDDRRQDTKREDTDGENGLAAQVAATIANKPKDSAWQSRLDAGKKQEPKGTRAFRSETIIHACEQPRSNRLLSFVSNATFSEDLATANYKLDRASDARRFCHATVHAHHIVYGC